MIDREKRNEFAAVVRDYLDERITAFQFDDRIFDIAHGTKDDTVWWCAVQYWHFYDDLKDHTVHATKESWDYMQRLLLLLESDVEVVVDKTTIWHWRQLVAAAGLLGFAVAVLITGIGPQLLLAAFPLGALAIVLDRFKAPVPTITDEEVRRTPFDSLAQLRRVRRALPAFSKWRYPTRLAEEWQSQSQKSQRQEEVFDAVYRAFGLVCFGPLVLFVQLFPKRKGHPRVVTL